ncbi:M23 family metallopeptidase [Maricaulis sp.]|jgi:murein DD-endopeptidase MepM/ murein hydrolase activator NlpD|uniref:M23 family metallopeptidase n=1 Tax=Maricaulis sp. TaxID=1486257 RepID=UPI00262B536C|nr:M23 family metallopeptidase [Maricaulis sp.]
MIALLLTIALQSAGGSADPIGELIAQNRGDNVRVGAAPQDRCRGQWREGSLLVCRFQPGTRVTLGEVSARADAGGFVTLGIPRQAPESLALRIDYSDAGDGTGQIVETVSIAQREYDLQHVDGVPQATVTPDPSTLPRRQREYAQKQDAFNSVWDGQGFLDGFIAPAEGITTGVYGSARVYNNGHEGNPHWGLDWANQEGTPIYAPAGGLVTLAEPDMYYEGGLIFIDHGQGLVSAFLHLSGVSVEDGDIVEQGQLIGQMGAGGRATGSHLDWRVKLRNGFYVDPQSLLDLDLNGLE